MTSVPQSIVRLLLVVASVAALGLASCSSTTNSIARNKPVGSLLNLPGELVNGVFGSVPVLNALKIPKLPLGF